MNEHTVFVQRGDRVGLGSCNACQNRTDEEVVQVTLTTMTFRLCHRCAKQLVEKLTRDIQNAEYPTTNYEDIPDWLFVPRTLPVHDQDCCININARHGCNCGAESKVTQ